MTHLIICYFLGQIQNLFRKWCLEKCKKNFYTTTLMSAKSVLKFYYIVHLCFLGVFQNQYSHWLSADIDCIEYSHTTMANVTLPKAVLSIAKIFAVQILDLMSFRPCSVPSGGFTKNSTIKFFIFFGLISLVLLIHP